LPIQADTTAESLHLFVEVDGRRLLLQELTDEQGTWFVDRRQTIRLRPAELQTLIAQTPERLSNNVFSRPLMQQFLLPVIATVLGRAETAYWQQLPSAFGVFGWTCPALLPRLEYTLIEPPQARALQKLQRTFAEVTTDYETARKQWLSAQDDVRWPTQFAAIRARLADLYEPLTPHLESLGSGMTQLASQNLQKMNEQVDYLERRVIAAAEQQHSAVLRQWERLHLAFYPLGKYQERVYNILVYLNRNGNDWVHRLLALPYEPSKAQQQLIYLSTTEEDHS
jgi:uncharacterized protein YllA (UPF0747 family)